MCCVLLWVVGWGVGSGGGGEVGWGIGGDVVVCGVEGGALVDPTVILLPLHPLLHSIHQLPSSSPPLPSPLPLSKCACCWAAALWHHCVTTHTTHATPPLPHSPLSQVGVLLGSCGVADVEGRMRAFESEGQRAAMASDPALRGARVAGCLRALFQRAAMPGALPEMERVTDAVMR